jgi:hypothetical protein
MSSELMSVVSLLVYFSYTELAYSIQYQALFLSILRLFKILEYSKCFHQQENGQTEDYAGGTIRECLHAFVDRVSGRDYE